MSTKVARSLRWNGVGSCEATSRALLGDVGEEVWGRGEARDEAGEGVEGPRREERRDMA